ncbi:hypothetical protein F4780DRAFT_346669 [Xylariomycetidae sp. FL0641]|nr:hypothetical protein F4780DRAFT_346669 [Xylariomycetidae sp. FL0641]
MAPSMHHRMREETGHSGSRQHGWVSSPNTRGTIDIIWPCITAIILLLYTMLHLNVPVPSDKARTVALRKLRWLFTGIFLPELIMVFAFAQFVSARQSVCDMKALGHNNWTLVHGFYADSGGFRLNVEGSKPFPITAKQLAYLVNHGYVDMPRITKREINDKSKADHVTKALAFLQTGWLLIKLIIRATQGLQITPFELATVALLVCSFIPLVLWWHKPLDVHASTPLYANKSIDTIAADQPGSAAIVDTPLDFIENNLYCSSNYQGTLLHAVLVRKTRTFPLDRIPNDREFNPRTFEQSMYYVLPVSIFSGIHLAGYNLSLPTAAEQTLWRINGIVMVVSLFGTGVFEVVGFWWTGYKVGRMELLGLKKKSLVCLIVLSLSPIFLLSRLIFFTEAVVSFRSLPADCYQEISWTQYLPHI